MATEKQLAAKKNFKTAHEAPSQTPVSGSTPKQKRREPRSTGDSQFYSIEVRPKEQFVIFRNPDVGDKGGIERLAGKRPSGLWDIATWLVSKNCAHVENERLVADKPDVKELFDRLGSPPVHVEGDIFKANRPRNVPEKEKRSEIKYNSRPANIKKARAAGNHK